MRRAGGRASRAAWRGASPPSALAALLAAPPPPPLSCCFCCAKRPARLLCTPLPRAPLPSLHACACNALARRDGARAVGSSPLHSTPPNSPAAQPPHLHARLLSAPPPGQCACAERWQQLMECGCSPQSRLAPASTSYPAGVPHARPCRGSRRQHSAAKRRDGRHEQHHWLPRHRAAQRAAVIAAVAAPDALVAGVSAPKADTLRITVGGREVRGAPRRPLERLWLTPYVAPPQIVLETGEIGRQAGGAVMATDGETVRRAGGRGRCLAPPSVKSSADAPLIPPPLPGVQMVYTTACADHDNASDGSFAPLQVGHAAPAPPPPPPPPTSSRLPPLPTRRSHRPHPPPSLCPGALRGAILRGGAHVGRVAQARGAREGPRSAGRAPDRPPHPAHGAGARARTWHLPACLPARPPACLEGWGGAHGAQASAARGPGVAAGRDFLPPTHPPSSPSPQSGWTHSTQLLSWVMSYDGEHSPEPLAIVAAGAALALSGVWAGGRVGWMGGSASPAPRRCPPSP